MESCPYQEVLQAVNIEHQEPDVQACGDTFDFLCSDLTETQYLARVKDVFRGKRLSDLLTMGIAEKINKCLDVTYRKKIEIIENAILLIDILLPKLPKYLEEPTRISEDSLRAELGIENDQTSVEQLANAIAYRALTYIYEFLAKTNRHRLSCYSAYLKVVNFVSLASLKKITSIENFRAFVQFDRTKGVPTCLVSDRILMKVIIMTAKRLNKKYSFPYPYSLIRLSKHALLVESAGAIRITGLNSNDSPEMKKILETIRASNKTIELLLCPESPGVLCNATWWTIMSFVCHKKSSYKFFAEADDKTLRAYLGNLLKFSWISRDKCKYDVALFKKILFHAKGMITLLTNSLFMFLGNICQTCKRNGDILYLDNLKAALHFLSYLDFLSLSWYQWFDIHSAPALTPRLEPRFNDLDVSESTVLKLTTHRALLFDLMSICPSAFNYKYRLQVFLSGPLQAKEEINRNPLELVIDEKNNILLRAYLSKVMHFTPLDFMRRWQVIVRNGERTLRLTEKEFIHLLALQYLRYNWGIWLLTSKNDTFPDRGLFPKKTSPDRLKLLYGLGQLAAKAIYGKHVLPLPLSVEFLECAFPNKFSTRIKRHYWVSWLVPETTELIKQLLSVKQEIYAIESNPSLGEEEKHAKIGSLKLDGKRSFSDASITFTMPGSEEELTEGGAGIILTPHNIDRYLECLSDAVMDADGGASVKAFRDGFDYVYPLGELSVFSPQELHVMLFGIVNEAWSVEYLYECCRFTGGYNKDSVQIKYLFQIMLNLEVVQRSRFIKFVNGSLRLPCQGLKGLSPPLTISMLPCEEGSHHLPSPKSERSVNLLLLPAYGSLETMEEKLLAVIQTSYY